MGGHRPVAMRETDVTTILQARDAVKRLDILALRLCYHPVSDDDICTLRECTADILAALELATLIASRGTGENENAT